MILPFGSSKDREKQKNVKSSGKIYMKGEKDIKIQEYFIE